VPGQNAADDIFVDFQAEGLGQVLRNPGAAKTRIAAFEFTDDLDLCGRGPFGPRPLEFGHFLLDSESLIA
jgi:hypothetical protein